MPDVVFAQKRPPILGDPDFLCGMPMAILEEVSPSDAMTSQQAREGFPFGYRSLSATNKALAIPLDGLRGSLPPAPDSLEATRRYLIRFALAVPRYVLFATSRFLPKNHSRFTNGRIVPPFIIIKVPRHGVS